MEECDFFCTELTTFPRPERGIILVSGATGYIGGRLVPELAKRGYRVRAMARADARSYQAKWPGAEWVEADVLKPETLGRAMAGVDTAYYLIHSLMLSARRFEAADLQAASHFRQAAEKQNVRRIIYLGGLGDMRGPLSAHLQSRTQVALELSKGPARLTSLRAAIIIGSGSASYEIIAGLVKKLRFIPLPRWTRTRCQPVSVRDVIKYLVGVLEIPETAGRSFDIGGPDILTYAEMLKIQKKLIGKKILFFPVFYSNTKFYAYLASLVVSVPAPIIRNLIKSIHYEVICQDSDIEKYLPFSTIPYKEALLRALSREEQDKIHTRWSDAYPPAFELAIKLDQLPEPPQFSKYYALETRKEADALFKSVCQIGGKKGWFHTNFLWRMRGLLDRLLLGIGTARGRRSHAHLQINDVIDFWRVEDLIPNQKLLLRAEMKLPGKAWLEFAIEDRGASRRLSVQALYYTRTLLGRINWYFFLPFHVFIFRDLIRGIEARSRPKGHSVRQPRRSNLV
jgi:uncharacterized protein YbjT (DUF2867 family)